MSVCTNPEIGKLLHPFELNQLGEADREAFEVHLLTCDHCFEEASKFDGVAGLLRSDRDVKNLIKDAAFEANERVSVWAKLREMLWPKTNFFLKPALSYFLILLLAVPAVIGIRSWRGRDIQGVQSLVLTGTRSPGESTVKAGRPLVVMFRIDGHRTGAAYRIQVRTEDDRIIYTDDGFNNINDREMATLLLDTGSFSSGSYQIEVFDSSGNRLHQYRFTVE